MTLKKLQTTFLLFNTSETIDFFKETKMFLKCPRDYTRPRTIPSHVENAHRKPET